MTGNTRVSTTQAHLTLWYCTAQIQSANHEFNNATTESERAAAQRKRDSAAETILRLKTLEQFTQSTRRQANHVAAQSLQTELLNLALQAKPITPSLQCILDFLGPNPKKLMALLGESASDDQIKKTQMVITSNLFLLQKKGLLSITEFMQTSVYDPNQPRIPELAWSTLFIDASLVQELASGSVRRYRLFPEYFEYCSTEQLQNYVLNCPAAEGANIFTTKRREAFTESDELLHQRPTIAYLFDGFRHAQKKAANNISCTTEEAFLLYLYDTDTDAKNSFMRDPTLDLTPSLLKELRAYKNAPNTANSAQLRAQLALLYQRHLHPAEHATHPSLHAAFFKPAPKNVHLKDAQLEWISQMIDSTLITPIRLHVTMSIAQLSTVHPTDSAHLNSLIKNVSTLANQKTKELSRNYAAQALITDQAMLAQDLHSECVRSLENILTYVTDFAQTKLPHNETLSGVLTEIVYNVRATVPIIDTALMCRM